MGRRPGYDGRESGHLSHDRVQVESGAVQSSRHRCWLSDSWSRRRLADKRSCRACAQRGRPRLCLGTESHAGHVSDQLSMVILSMGARVDLLDLAPCSSSDCMGVSSHGSCSRRVRGLSSAMGPDGSPHAFLLQLSTLACSHSHPHSIANTITRDKRWPRATCWQRHRINLSPI